ncbi:hypothetical protein ACHAWU_003441 [Discostella pseudostelligera]|uniref:Uncharacterized protein n=1 Tax=Discostella pseudostelligera TaxID=259834 RepID=A0ABD3MRT8_9STRA
MRGLRKGLALVDTDRRAKRKSKSEMDCSRWTVGSDSEHNGAGFIDPDGRQQLLKSCLKVRTQLESLSKIDDERKVTTVPMPSSELRPVSETKLVSFESVEFRQYVLALSDNPSTTSGPPIGLGWNFIPEDTIRVDIDLYEQGCEGIRRRGRELAIPRDLRENLLREVGYTRSDMVNAIRSVQRDKKRRNVSFHQQKYDPIVERVESMKCCFRRLIY